MLPTCKQDGTCPIPPNKRDYQCDPKTGKLLAGCSTCGNSGQGFCYKDNMCACGDRNTRKPNWGLAGTNCDVIIGKPIIGGLDGVSISSNLAFNNKGFLAANVPDSEAKTWIWKKERSPICTLDNPDKCISTVNIPLTEASDSRKWWVGINQAVENDNVKDWQSSKYREDMFKGVGSGDSI
jgi:hypothetical protein